VPSSGPSTRPNARPKRPRLSVWLLGLSYLEAVRDAASLLGLQLRVLSSPDIARLLKVPGTNRPPDRTLRIGVAQGSARLFASNEDLPAFRTASRVYASLPSRYYFDVERRLGLRLPRNHGFLPVLPALAVHRDRPFVCYIAASSWPEKKDYGIRGFARVAEIIGDDFEHVVVRGLDDPPETHPPLTLAPEWDDIEALLGLFAEAALIIGNDTGLLHAAAMTATSSRRGVIGIYGRHSYLRFTTGDRHQYAIATPFAERTGDRPLLDLTSGYVQRSKHLFPKQGERDPWLVRQNYLRDVIATPRADVTRDMTFTRRPATAPLEEITR